MDWSWLLPALFGVAVTLGVTWLQDWWRDRRRRSAEKRARMERRLDVVREHLVSVGNLAAHIWEIETWNDPGAEQRYTDEARRQWFAELDEKRKTVYGSPVGVAWGLFVQDERLLQKLDVIESVMGEWIEWGQRASSGEDVGDVLKLRVALNRSIRDAQEVMDRMVYEL